MFFTPNGITFPKELSLLLEKELELSPKSRQSLPELWKHLAVEKGIKQEGISHYSSQKDFVQLYASYYLPSNLLKASLVLEEAYLQGVDLMGPHCRWLDIGTGPGTALWGVHWWAKQRDKHFEFLGLDQSTQFTALATKLAHTLGAKNAKFEKPHRILDSIDFFRPTVISFMNSFTEIFPTLEEKKEALKSIARKAFAGKKNIRLIIIEPGTLEISRALAEVKDSLREQEDVSILFPCLDNRKCGALEKPKDWCHEEVACEFPDWLNEIGQSVQMKKDALIFSYVVIEFGKPAQSKDNARVVSQRLERKGQVECWICTQKGKVYARSQRSKATDPQDPVLTCNRGDLWKDWSLGPKGDLIGANRVSPEKSIF